MSRHCAVVGCCNGDYKLNKWKGEICLEHECHKGMNHCLCPPPYRLFPFPTVLRNAQGRERWKRAINRPDGKTPWCLLEPTDSMRVCSCHFVDGEPTTANPDPTLQLGYTRPASKTLQTRNTAPSTAASIVDCTEHAAAVDTHVQVNVYQNAEDHSYCKSWYKQTLDVRHDAVSGSLLVSNQSTCVPVPVSLVDGIPSTEPISAEMEMTCESYEEQYTSSGCWEEPNPPSATFQPSIVSVTSLMPADCIRTCNSNHASPDNVLPTTVRQQTHSLDVSEVSIKQERINLACHVMLETLPQRLVQTAATSAIFVTDWSSTLVPPSNAAHTLVSAQTVKNEPDDIDIDSLQYEEHLAAPHDAVCQNPEITSPTDHTVETGQHIDHDRTRDQSFANRKSAGTMTGTAAVGTNPEIRDSAVKTSASVNTMPDGVDRNISVIVLNSAQRARTASSDDVDSVQVQPRNIAQLVLSTLQQRKVNSLPSVNSDSCAYVLPDENRQLQKTKSTKPRPIEDMKVLRKMLYQSRMEHVATAVKLNREEAKVRNLLKEVESLRKTVSQGTSIDNLGSSSTPINSSE